MHPVGQQQQQRRGNSTRMPLMYTGSLPPTPLLSGPPQTSRYGVISNFQQSTTGIGGGMKHHQRGSGNRGGRGSTIIHRQQRPTSGSRYHPYPFRPPLPPQQQQQQRSYRPAQPLPRTPAALMGTPPGMSQSEYELIHSAQVQRDKRKLDVLAPSNTTQFLIRDHNRQTPSAIATPTPTHQTTSPSTTQGRPSLPYDQMFEMGDVDAQSDDTESNQDFGIGDIDPSVDNDFNDIYYQCRYERYAAFSRNALLNEVLSLCANIDRLQHEKSEVEKRLRDVQQHLYDLTTTSNSVQERSIQDEGNQVHEDQTRFQSSLNPQQQENDSTNADEPNHMDDELQASTSSQPIVTEHKETDESLVETNLSKNNGSEQQIVHD
ncbi:unnamed protein product [Rotaria sordida]|uniref:Uncharacterized protein n=1 Tax=Rotaria sordida TaxID=392033 RepID=A0A814NW43_9BILA|nr:unnamed protein product [Rotaria sordida]CAF1098866.1 unnamed protein product [Rotaria sordida]CAF1197725.1 unnamed protein product [Rotaria sordida]CAF3728841.1 unnamed protein product [Rotaria sordida]